MQPESTATEQPKPNRRQRRAMQSAARKAAKKSGQGSAPAPAPASGNSKGDKQMSETQDSKANGKGEDQTAREKKVAEVYESATGALPDSGIEYEVTGLPYKHFALIGRVFGPMVSRAAGMITVKRDEQGQPILDDEGNMILDQSGVDQEGIVQTVLQGMVQDPLGILLMQEAMCNLDRATIEELTIQDGSVLLEVCTSKIRQDDVRSFFRATAKLAGQQTPGTA